MPNTSKGKGATPTRKHSMKCPKLYGKKCTCDGYHIFDELYEHRNRLFVALLNLIQNENHASGETLWEVWKSKVHSDGTMFEGGWFIAGIKRGEFGDITYHLPIRLWDKLVVPEYDAAPEWDGHTPEDVLERLLEL